MNYRLRLIIRKPRPTGIEVVHGPELLMSDPIGDCESSLPSNFPNAHWWQQYVEDKMGAFTRKEGRRISNFKIGDWYDKTKKGGNRPC